LELHLRNLKGPFYEGRNSFYCFPVVNKEGLIISFSLAIHTCNHLSHQPAYPISRGFAPSRLSSHLWLTRKLLFQFYFLDWDGAGYDFCVSYFKTV
jgi:hypothetical protein